MRSSREWSSLKRRRRASGSASCELRWRSLGNHIFGFDKSTYRRAKRGTASGSSVSVKSGERRTGRGPQTVLLEVFPEDHGEINPVRVSYCSLSTLPEGGTSPSHQDVRGWRQDSWVLVSRTPWTFRGVTPLVAGLLSISGAARTGSGRAS